VVSILASCPGIEIKNLKLRSQVLIVKYTLGMARGWESKSVEDQIGAAEAERELRSKPHLSDRQRQEEEHRKSLLLSRSQILNRMRAATNPRYRTQLQSALDHIEAQLKEREPNRDETA
jgi:hypothetical protein